MAPAGLPTASLVVALFFWSILSWLLHASGQGLDSQSSSSSNDEDQILQVNQFILLSKEFRCAECKAVAFQLHRGFSGAHEAVGSSKGPLKESEYSAAIDRACAEATFTPYRIVRDGSGGTFLVGPGLAGMNPGGPGAHLYVSSGPVPQLARRMAATCFTLFQLPDNYEDPEEILYRTWVDLGRLEALEFFLCGDPSDGALRSSCLQ